MIAKLAERSPIIIQNSGKPSSRKNLDLQPYDHTTVQGATFNMRGQSSGQCTGLCVGRARTFPKVVEG